LILVDLYGFSYKIPSFEPDSSCFVRFFEQKFSFQA